MFKVSLEDIIIYGIGFPFFSIFIKKEIDITTKEKKFEDLLKSTKFDSRISNKKQRKKTRVVSNDKELS